MKNKFTFKILIIVAIFSCSVVPAKKTLHGSNENVIVSTQQPDLNKCKFLGQISGNQGNLVSGLFTSNANLEIVAINNLKNKAFKMGGNYVEIILNNTGESGANVLSNFQTNVDNVGNTYKCSYNANS
jgi:hypothetical protein